MADEECNERPSLSSHPSTSTSFDEKLSDCVRKYTILYDKSSRDFKDKQKKKRAWTEVAKETGISSAKEAEIYFRNLRNRYGREKRKIKSVKVSGSGTENVSDAKKEISEIFPYLQWLEKYVQPRNTTSNLQAHNGSDGEDIQDDSDDAMASDDTSMSAQSNSADCDKTLTSSVTGRPKYRKRSSKPVVKDELDNLELKLLHNVGERLIDNKSQKSDKDEAALFGELIASQLRQLPFQQRQMAKMEITNALCYRLLNAPGVGNLMNAPGMGNPMNTPGINNPISAPGMNNPMNAPGMSNQINIPEMNNLNRGLTDFQTVNNCPVTPSQTCILTELQGPDTPQYPPGYLFERRKRS